MNKNQFSTLLESIQSAECQVREDGQKEYSHDESNVFANFDRVAASLQLDRKQVLLVYALKHWDGIVSYVGGHKSQREDVRGRIKDLRMYLALLWGMVEEEEEMICGDTEMHEICFSQGEECSYCGKSPEQIEVTTHADGPDNSKFTYYIPQAD